MKLICLGTGGYHPNSRRHTACYAIPELNLVLDAGTGAFRIPDLLTSTQLSVVLSHAHLDHICGLTYLLVPLLTQKLSRVDLYAEQKTIDAIEKHLFSQLIFPMRPDLTMHAITPGDSIALPQKCSLQTCPLTQHPGGSLGMKIVTPTSSLAYVTDTTTNDDYLPFISGVDHLVHECYFPDEMAHWCEQSGHSHTTAVAQIARKAAVKKLWLMHIGPDRSGDDPIGIQDAHKIFPQTTLLEDFMQIDF